MSRAVSALMVEAKKEGLDDAIRSFAREYGIQGARAGEDKLGWFALMKDGSRRYLALTLNDSIPRLKTLKKTLRQERDSAEFIARNKARDARRLKKELKT